MAESPKEVIQRFFDNTTCHGLQQVSLDKKIQAVLWCSLSAVLAGLCCWYLYDLLKQVRLYQVQLIPSISDEPVPFPAVTVCNINPFMQSKLNKIPELAAIEKYTREKMHAYEGEQSWSEDGTPCLYWRDTQEPHKKELENYCRNPGKLNTTGTSPSRDTKGPWCYVGRDDKGQLYGKYCFNEQTNPEAGYL